MNKERLEELKKMRLLYEVCFVDEYASAIDDVTADFDLLIKRVQELEDIIYQDARQGVIEGLYEENKRYREALEFYADLKNWRKTHAERASNSPSKVIADTGERARKALEESE